MTCYTEGNCSVSHQYKSLSSFSFLETDQYFDSMAPYVSQYGEMVSMQMTEIVQLGQPN